MHDEAKPGVDVVFGLGGTSLPHDHAEALALAVAVWLPWLEDEPSAGIHPLRTAPTTQGMVLLARRARLTLRVPAHRAAASLGLSEKRLEVGEGLAIGGGEVKAFVPSPTLYSGRVATTARDDRAFHDEVARWLDAVGVHGEIISGRPRRLAAGGQEVLAYGLALHGLSPADSVRVQGEGLGPHRRLGCGIFVPHKAIAVSD